MIKRFRIIERCIMKKNDGLMQQINANVEQQQQIFWYC